MRGRTETTPARRPVFPCTSEGKKQAQHWNRKHGYCRDCYEKAEPGKARCAYHQAANRQQHRKWYEQKANQMVTA